MALSYIHSGNKYAEFKTYDEVLAKAKNRAQKGEDITIYQSLCTVGKQNSPVEVNPCLFEPSVNLPQPKVEAVNATPGVEECDCGYCD